MKTTNTLGTVVILTALNLELYAVRAHLQHVREETHPQGTIYVVGWFPTPQGSWKVAVVQTGQGNTRAALEAERAISFFNPKYVFFVGVAGGIKDVDLGDVVAGTKIYYYEMGKAEDEYKPRPDIGVSAYRLVQRAQAVVSQHDWQKRIIDGTDIPPAVNAPTAFIGPIAAGEKVIASITSPHYAFLRQNFSDVIAVEMEGFGLLLAVHANFPVEAIVLRGISDLIAEKEQVDKSGSQPRAARNAAAFTFEILAHISSDKAFPPVLPDSVWEQLREIATALYPTGPQDRHIWERAGGDIALLKLGSTGRATWFSASRELKLGGGGLITVEKLLSAMQEDYPANPELGDLYEQVARLS
jgi:nucleoside phosphorylase